MNIDCKRRYVYFYLLFLYTVELSGQNAPFAAWASVLVNSRFNSHWSNTFDLGYRTLGSDFIPYQNYFRTGLRYHFDPQVTALCGLSYFNTKTSFLPENHEYGHEFRIYQEIQRQSSRNKKILLDLRLRNEQRFFSGTSKRDPYHSFRLAGRMMAGYQFNNQFTWQIGSEYFESLTFNKLIMDQVRFINQIIVRMNKGFSLNLMYMYTIRKAYEQSVFNFVIVKNFNFDGLTTPAR